MIKRPLNVRFGPKVLAGIKRTTIRDTAWPLGKPIMLYHWSGKPYASPQQDVAAVIVQKTLGIIISRQKDGVHFKMTMTTADFFAWCCADWDDHPSNKPSSDLSLWELEGFDSRDDMDAWFRAKLKPGQTVHKHLMLFRLLQPET